jgi:anti-sigma factor RsiW
MMTCQTCRELITDYQHGELPAASDAAMFDHISTCTQCREELAAQSELTDSLRAAYAQELELPVSVIAGVRQAVRTERTSAFVNALRAVLRPVVLAPTAAAIMLVAGVITYVHNGTNAAPAIPVSYLVRQHVVHTMNSQSGDRAWNAYLLTSATSEDANAPAK